MIFPLLAKHPKVIFSETPQSSCECCIRLTSGWHMIKYGMDWSDKTMSNKLKHGVKAGHWSKGWYKLKRDTNQISKN